VGSPLVILNIPSGGEVVLSNLQFAATLPQSGIVAVDCAGDVLLEDIYHEASPWPGSHLRFERCANVVLRGCEFRQVTSPLTVIDSNLLMTTTSVTGTWIICGLGAPPHDPMPLSSHADAKRAEPSLGARTLRGWFCAASTFVSGTAAWAI
jgi:hypothetical protein